MLVTELTARRPKRPRFEIEPGVNGVDLTFEVVCTGTNDVLVRVGYWEQKAEALKQARLIVRSLNVLYELGSETDLSAFLSSYIDNWTDDYSKGPVTYVPDADGKVHLKNTMNDGE